MSKLSKAVVRLMGDLKRLKKDSRNDHGRYDFTSVDDFKDAIRPLMAENGLHLHVSQTAFQMISYIDGKGNDKSVAQFDIAITLHHKSGQRAKPENMTVALPFTGAQTSGAARSYAVKEWMKSRFLASSGDEQDEADLLEQSREGLRLAKAEARDLSKELDKEIREVIAGADHEKLKEWWTENLYRINTLPKDWFIQFRTNFITEGKRLKAEHDLDRMSNEQLDELADTQQEAA